MERTDSCHHNMIPGYRKDRRIEKSSTVNVKVDGDKYACSITGIHVLDNGDTLMCDRRNDNVKLMDTSGHITSSLRMEGEPWDVAGIGNGEAAVTLSNKKIEIVRIDGKQVKHQKGRGMKTDRSCWGLAYHRDNLYVSCHDNPGNSEVIILDKQGQLIRKIPGPDNLKYPNYIAVDRIQLILSDSNTCKHVQVQRKQMLCSICF